MAWLIITRENHRLAIVARFSVSDTTGVETTLPLNNLGHLEEDSVRIWSTGQNALTIEGWSDFVGTKAECRCFWLASFGQLIGDLRRGSNAGGIQLVELGKIVEHRVQVTEHACLLAARQLEIGEFGHTLDVLLGYGHYADFEKSTAQEFARLETQQKTVS